MRNTLCVSLLCFLACCGTVTASVPDSSPADARAVDAGTDARALDATACPTGSYSGTATVSACDQADSADGPACHTCILRFADGHLDSFAGDCCDFPACLSTFGPWAWGPCS
jgi:hypothetical protein